MESTTASQKKVKYPNPLTLAWIIWGLAATFYFSDYLARVAPTVMHRSLQIDFGINEAQLSILMSMFYVPYVVMQIPVGLTVDRLSIRGILTVMSLITAVGCCIFGLSHGLAMASFGRVLVGFSAAFAFISALRLATSWFPPAKLGLLSGLTQALGMLGAAAAASVSFLVVHLGWRYSMFLIASFFVVLAGFLYQFVQDGPGLVPRKTKMKRNPFSIAKSLAIILSNKQTWINALYAGFLFAPTAVIGEAIGPDYLQFGRGLSPYTAAFATGLIFIGWAISGPFTGWISDRIGRRKPLMIVSALCGLLLTTLFVFVPNLSSGWIFVLFFIYGLTNTGVAVAYAVSTEIHDVYVVGTSIAFTNMASIFVGAAMQPVVGHLVDLAAGVTRSLNLEHLNLYDFQAGLKILPLCSFIAFILALCIKETWCRPCYQGHHEK